MSADQSLPSVSVIVPAFRRADRLSACLEALAAQDHPRGRFELVVVDDGSPTPLETAVEPFAERLRVRVHRQANAGPAAARNTGARLASGDVLAFTDDDCTPATDWVRRLALTLRDHPDTLVGGHVVNALAADRYAEASQQLIAFLYDWYGPGRQRRFFASNNLAVGREQFLELGGFDESFPRPGGEDRDLCERWERSGRSLLFAADAVVHHAHGMDLTGFWRQHRNYGRGAYQLHRRRSLVEEAPLRVEPARFYARLVTFPFGKLPLRQALAASGLLVLSQAANAAGFFEELIRSRR